VNMAARTARLRRATGLLPSAARLRGHSAAALLFALLAIALLWPVLLGGRVLTSNSILYFLSPWAPQKPADVTSYLNPVLSDIPQAYYPWWSYARDSLRSLQLPQWNPFALAGTPFFANPQSALFSPFSLPLWLLPLNYGLGLAAALRLWVGSFGAYLLGRQLGLGFWPAVLTGIAFGFSPFFVLWLSFPLLNVIAFLPWALWLTERVVVRGRLLDNLLLTIVLALGLLGGHPGSQIHLYAIVGAYAALRLALGAAGPLRVGARRFAHVLGAGLLALLVAAVALLPAALSVPGTAGEFARSGGGPLLPWESARTLFFPDWWGRPDGVLYGGPYNFNERTIYAGAVALVLAVLALSTTTQWRQKLPFAILAFAGFQAAFGLEPTHAVLQQIPALSDDRHSRLSVLVQLGAAVLAGFALQEFTSAGWRRSRIVLAAFSTGIVAAAGLIGAGPSLQEVRTAVHHFRTGEDYARPDVIQTVSVGWWGLLTAALLAVLVLRRTLGKRGLALAVVALAAFDVGHFAWGYNPMPPEHRAIPQRPPSVAFLQKQAANDHFAGLGAVLPPDASVLYRLRDIRGYDPPKPDLRFFRLFKLLNSQQPPGDWLAIHTLSDQGRNVLDLLGARYLMMPPGSAPPAQPGFTRVYTGVDADVYRNQWAVQRAFVPTLVTRVESEEEALGRIGATGFDPRREAVVEDAEIVPAGTGTARVLEDKPSAVDLQVRLRRAGLVVLADTLDDGWRVTVDGRSVSPVRVDSVLRGVRVAAGAHTVRWRYRTPGLLSGAGLSALGLIVVGAVVFALTRRRNRTRTVALPART
jgi:hypothetical protein